MIDYTDEQIERAARKLCALRREDPDARVVSGYSPHKHMTPRWKLAVDDIKHHIRTEKAIEHMKKSTLELQADNVTNVTISGREGQKRYEFSDGSVAYESEPSVKEYMMSADPDGYPSEAMCNTIRDWPCEGGYDALLISIEDAGLAAYGYLMWDAEEDGTPTWKLVTGGWSGWEEVVEFLRLNHQFWSTRWRWSGRGGVHVFDRYLEAEGDD